MSAYLELLVGLIIGALLGASLMRWSCQQAVRALREARMNAILLELYDAGDVGLSGSMLQRALNAAGLGFWSGVSFYAFMHEAFGDDDEVTMYYVIEPDGCKVPTFRVNGRDPR